MGRIGRALLFVGGLKRGKGERQSGWKNWGKNVKEKKTYREKENETERKRFKQMNMELKYTHTDYIVDELAWH